MSQRIDGVVDAAADVKVDPAVLAPQHAACRWAAGVDEVAQIQGGGDVGVLDEVKAVAAGSDAVGGAAKWSGVSPAAAAEDGGLLVGAGGGHDLAVTAGAGGDLCGDRRRRRGGEQLADSDSPAAGAQVCRRGFGWCDPLAVMGFRVRLGARVCAQQVLFVGEVAVDPDPGPHSVGGLVS